MLVSAVQPACRWFAGDVKNANPLDPLSTGWKFVANLFSGIGL
jgi:hypothetical protein